MCCDDDDNDDDGDDDYSYPMWRSGVFDVHWAWRGPLSLSPCLDLLTLLLWFDSIW
jgi:hypothetical protein